MASEQLDERFMRVALQEGRKGLGQTSPNPAVGAVLVRGRRIIARGHHKRAGAKHAEVECLARLPSPVPPDSTLYVTLEPCSTVGRTGRCTDAIIRAGVRRVVIGAIDPNPEHEGRGIDILRKAGIEVRTNVLEAECSALNEAFNKWIVTGLPFVIAKCGMSLDGRLTRPPDEPGWITGAVARRDSHRLRSQVDAIIIGAETARADDPRLTVRGVGRSKQPWRVVLASSGRLPAGLKLFQDRFKDRTLLYRRKSLRAVLKDLGEKSVTSVLIEGGGSILGQALDGRLIDKVQIYLGPILTGGPIIAFAGRGAGSSQEALRLQGITYARLGDNVCVAGYPKVQKKTEIE
jgi:diaminohydroxyphosphoribosylaminopyrimidine deaminase / 5-amino-6-(5-phosphoribosylamino)uracil reductase